MTDTALRKQCNPMLFIVTLSIKISPRGSDNLNNDARNEDFPAPVRPTIPTYSEYKKYIRDCLIIIFTFRKLDNTSNLLKQ